jgi:hypothetical protein
MLKRAFVALIATRIVANFIQIPIQIGSMYAIKIFLDRPVKKYLLEDSSDQGSGDPRSGDQRSGDQGAGFGGDPHPEA